MRSITKFLLIFLMAFMLIGCATSGPKFSEYELSMSEVPAESGRIYLYRTAILGAAIQPDVKLDGEVIGSAVPKGFFYVDTQSGNHEIMTSTEVERKLSFKLEPGETRYVRLNISMGFFVGHVYPELVETYVGEKEIQDCRYIGD